MRIVIIGAVAAGTSASAKARRNSEDAQIVIYEKDSYISYSGCGMPYFIAGAVKEQKELYPRDPEFFKSKYNVDVLTRHEVLSVDTKQKKLEVKNLSTGQVFTDHYDKLLFATGARAVLPPIKGIEGENVFALRNILDMQKIKAFIDEKNPKSAAIVGSGFIGMEMCESLIRLGLKVAIIEKNPTVSPLDSDMSLYVRDQLEKNGVSVYTGVTVKQIEKDQIELEGGSRIDAELVVLGAGVRPEVALAQKAGVRLGSSGAIEGNERMETNVPDVYACGDCAEVFSLITGKKMFCPLGSTANKTGRIAGDAMTGGGLAFRGILGTGIYRIFDLTVARTGLSEKQAAAEGFDVAVSHNIKPNKQVYLGGKEMVIKAVADKKSGRILGAEITGPEGVDKRIDVFVTAISFGARAEDLFHLDLAYAPPYSTTKDPVMYSGMILDNAIRQGRPLITPRELQALLGSGEKFVLIDTRVESQYAAGHIKFAQNIPIASLRAKMNEIDKDATVVTYCNSGVTGNAAQNILINNGFKKVFNISGGYKNFKMEFPEEA